MNLKLTAIRSFLKYCREEDFELRGAVNFKIDDSGVMRCPNGKAFKFSYRKAVKGNRYGRQEEIYVCEDCGACPYTAQCKKTDKERTMRLNSELTAMHGEMVENLESIRGARNR